MSGLAGISYEILYGRILGNLIGDQFAVSAAILITFLLGIGIGSGFAWRLWSWLWLIELLIGVCGVAFAFGGDALETLLYTSLPMLPSGLTGSIIACILLLLTPAFLIGCSVPLFAGYMSRLAVGTDFSTVYAVYNFGAALTAILIEYLLLRWFGIRGAMLCFIALNLLIATALRFGFAIPEQSPALPAPARQTAITTIIRQDWLALVPISMASAIFQLLMVKLAEMLLGPFRESFALVLSIVLLGIALGSMLVRRFHISFQNIVLLALAGILLFFAVMEPVAYLYASLYETASKQYITTVLLKWFCLLLLMGLPALAFGATVPALIVAVRKSGGDNHGNDGSACDENNLHGTRNDVRNVQSDAPNDISRESGHLLFVASMANVAGFLLMVFVLHRYLDYGVIMLVICLLAAASLLLHSGRRPASVLMAGLLLLGSGALYRASWDEELLYVSYTNFRSVDDLNEARRTSVTPERYKGYQDVFAINRVDGSPYFFINGYNSIPLNNPSERIVGAVSSYYAPRTNKALVLGLGSGATASVVGQLFKHTDVVEINPVVRQNLFRMKQWNFNIESNPNVNIVVDDAIHYTRAGQKTGTPPYDLILNTVTTPLYFSSSKLYTRDFFDVIKRRLTADGIYVTWMDARIGDKGVDIILNTIRHSFRHCALLYIKSSYFLLICSDEPVTAQALPQFRPGQQIYDNLLKSEGIVPEWLKYQLLSDDVLPMVSDSKLPLNEDDYPALEFEMARLSGRGIAGFKRRLRQRMNLDTVRHAVGKTTAMYPSELVWHTELRLKNSSFTRRWKALALQYRTDFEQTYHRIQQDYLQRLLTADSHAGVFHELGFRLMQSHRYREALTAFQYALDRDSRHVNTHFNMAACYEYLGDFRHALQYYRMAGQLDPNDKDVPFRMGRVYVKMKRYPDALVQLRRAARMMGQNASWHLYDYLGQAYEGQGQTAQATEAYRQSKKLHQ